MGAIPYSANFNQGMLASAVFVIDIAGMTALASAITALPAGHAAIAPLQAIQAYMIQQQANAAPVPPAAAGTNAAGRPISGTGAV